MGKLFFKYSMVSAIIMSYSFIHPPIKTLGVFKAIKLVTCNDTSATASLFNGMAELFQNPPIEGLTPAVNYKDGTISLNSRNLFYDNELQMYMDSARRSSLNPISWKLMGATGIPNFSITVIKPIPTFTNFAGIPKTLVISEDYVLNFGSVQNVDKIEFVIQEENNYCVINPWYRKIPGAISSLTIPKHQISTFKKNTELIIIVNFINEEERLINGVRYAFENRLQIIKKVKVV